MSAPCKVLAQYIIEQGWGLQPPAELDWQTFYGSMPAAGDNSICVYDTAGLLDGRSHRTGVTVEHHGLQVRVRGEDYDTAYNKIKFLYDRMDEVNQITIVLVDGVYVIECLTKRSPIIYLGQEEGNQRVTFTFNLTATFR